MKRLGRAAVLAAPVLVLATAVAGPAAGTGVARVTVQADRTITEVPRDPMGTDDVTFDPNMHAPGSATLVHDAGLSVRSLNSGPWTDVYRWRTNTYDHDPITDGQGVDAVPANNFDAYMGEVQKSGAQELVHVNYGSTADAGSRGTDIGPAEAADWVRHANIQQHDGVKYWEIGEEVYGNGFYSALGLPPFEPDHHADKSPTAYGENVVKFARAMKAVDPTIKIGVGLTVFGLPGLSNPAGQPLPDWNDPVLAAAGDAVDFVDLHWYNMGDASDAALFASTAQVPTAMSDVRQELAAHGSHAQIVVGETNTAASDPGTQQVSTVGALYAADDVSTWLEQGADNVDWYATHLYIVPDQPGSPDDPTGTGYGDWGMLSAGVCRSDLPTVCEPPVNTPFPAYYGLQLTSRMAQPGARLVRTSSSDPHVVAHAAVQRDGSLVVLVENLDPSAAHPVSLDYPGYRAAPVATTYGYGRHSTSVRRGIGASGTALLAPYSITELVLHR